MYSRRGDGRSARFVLALLAASLLLVVNAMPASASAPMGISGHVTVQGGGVLAGVAVTVTAPGQTIVLFGPVHTGADGSFALETAAGVYDVHFAPPGDQNPVIYTNLSVSTAVVLSVVLTQSTSHTLSGTVRDAAGSPVSGVNVHLHAVDHSGRGGATRTDDAGRYSLTVPPLAYRLQIRDEEGGWALYSDPATLDLTNTDIQQDFRLPTFVTLTVIVKDAMGNPFAGARATAGTGQQSGFGVAPGLTYQAAAGMSKLTDVGGRASFLVFSGFTIVPGQVCATYPDNTQTCSTNTFSTDSDVTVELTKATVPHTLSGTVRDAAGNPVPGVNVHLHAVDQSGRGGIAQTDTAGRYWLTVPPLVYRLQVRDEETAWALFSDPATFDLTNADVQQDFQLPPYVTFTVTVKDPGGAPIPGARVVAGTGQQSGFGVAPGLTYQAAAGMNKLTDPGGRASFLIFSGFTLLAHQICATFEDGTRACHTATVTTATATDVTIELVKVAVPHSISGVVRDAAGNPVPDVDVHLDAADLSGHGGVSRTDSVGRYAITVPPKVYRLQIRDEQGGWALYSDPTTLDLTNTDIQQDFRLPPFVTLTVTVKDADGAPVAGARATAATGQQSGFTVAPGLTYQAAAGMNKLTDSGGRASFSLFTGLVLPPGSVCAIYPDSAQVCNSTTIVANADSSLLFQRQPAAPAAPAGLSAVTPTRHPPVLTWNASAGAVRYLVYRAGAVTAGTTDVTFTDLALPNDGTFSYAVAAVGADGSASAPSAPVTVVYDTTAPVVLGTPDHSANTAGWYNAPVIIAWASGDPAPSAGTPTQPATTTVTTEGADQTVVSAASCDPAGNCSIGTQTVSIDTTPPAITYLISPAPNPHGWHDQAVTVTFVCTDGLSGVAACPVPVTVAMDGADRAITGTATDHAGNSASATAVVSVDTTAPTITATVSGAAGQAGWNQGDVTVTFTCADALSGIASCSTPITLTEDGANQLVHGEATDRAGNAAEVTVSISIDRTKPSIVATRTAANGHGWNNGDVIVTFSCADAQSGIAACTDPVAVTAEGADQSVVGQAVNHTGGQATVEVPGINIDKTAPTASATVLGVRNPAGWYNVAPTIRYACADGLSGMDSCPSDVTVMADGAQQRIIAIATDRAGNASDASVTGLNVDRTAPVVTVTGATNGATYPIDQLPSPACGTTDSTSGVATQASLTIVRNSAGGYTAVCSGATDVAGNSAPDETIHYFAVPSAGALSSLTSAYVTATGAPNAHGVMQNLSKQLARGDICRYIMLVNGYTDGRNPALTPIQAAELIYWARLMDPTC